MSGSALIASSSSFVISALIRSRARKGAIISDVIICFAIAPGRGPGSSAWINAEAELLSASRRELHNVAGSCGNGINLCKTGCPVRPHKRNAPDIQTEG
jgi:hypothetical protein